MGGDYGSHSIALDFILIQLVIEFAYSGCLNSKYASIIVDTVESRKCLNLGVLVSDTNNWS